MKYENACTQVYPGLNAGEQANTGLKPVSAFHQQKPKSEVWESGSALDERWVMWKKNNAAAIW